ncbi:hypothetical protein ACJJTC_017019 [Scirpophaga incertulas]
MDHPGGFASSPWAAMLGHGVHGVMQHEYSHAHASMPMDLHVPQPFPYYRKTDSKAKAEELKISSGTGGTLQCYLTLLYANLGNTEVVKWTSLEVYQADIYLIGKVNPNFLLNIQCDKSDKLTLISTTASLDIRQLTILF